MDRRVHMLGEKAEESIIAKALTLLFSVLLALASVGGYRALSEKIADAERRIAEGERRLDEGRAALEKGQADLEAGKRAMVAAKEAVETIEDIPFAEEVDELLGGWGAAEIDRRIAEGDEQIASGEDRMASGRQRIAAGERALRRGKERLQTAERIRIAFALGAALFALLSIALGVRWWRSRTRSPSRADP